MKELVKKTTYIKFYVGIFFSSEILLYACLAPLWELKSISLPLIWQMLLIAMIITIIQYIIYTSDIFRKWKTLSKVLFEFILMMVIGYILAIVFKWFDITNIKSNIIYQIIYNSSFWISAYSIYLYNKVTGDDLNRKLKIYKSNIKKNEVK